MSGGCCPARRHLKNAPIFLFSEFKIFEICLKALSSMALILKCHSTKKEILYK